jgi:excisionase family DNA binding protein
MPRSVLLEHAAELLRVSRRTVYYRIRQGRLQTVRTMGGSQRVLVESIERLLREEMGLTVPGAGVSDTAPSAKSPEP